MLLRTCNSLRLPSAPLYGAQVVRVVPRTRLLTRVFPQSFQTLLTCIFERSCRVCFGCSSTGSSSVGTLLTLLEDTLDSLRLTQLTSLGIAALDDVTLHLAFDTQVASLLDPGHGVVGVTVSRYDRQVVAVLVVVVSHRGVIVVGLDAGSVEKVVNVGRDDAGFNVGRSGSRHGSVHDGRAV